MATAAALDAAPRRPAHDAVAASRSRASGGGLPLPKLSLGLSPAVVRSLVGIFLLGSAP